MPFPLKSFLKSLSSCLKTLILGTSLVVIYVYFFDQRDVIDMMMIDFYGFFLKYS